MSEIAIPAAFEEIERSWRPADQYAEDVVTAQPPALFSAILDQPPVVQADGDPLPPLWHWFLFAPAYRQSTLGEDGHPEAASFTPPLPDRRRMFGGGRLEVHEPLRCGEHVTRRSSLVHVNTHIGRTGPLLLLTVRHELAVAGQLRISEEQDLVYRRAADVARTRRDDVSIARSAEQAPPSADRSLTVRPDPRLLFRFSALTNNAHRIHYDRPYAEQVEGHPGLVVHGPLLALLLLELPRRHDPRPISWFTWRAPQPVYDRETVEVVGWRHEDGWDLAAGAAGNLQRVTGTTARAGR
ncbi:FAS1-like dehydratase domain-containing protein [Nitriliruptor alkaliphilus]|uniref:FAS1-like dehydratase domain-containing protein n=1 Tax=Nitriliruptor alkaliphilus TaxID=427918 RepID=UPI000695EF7B|nr:MaoC family dehydratase N-terminal domain-containing protein [Nitriliruptor alkaliphilus]